MKRKGRKMEEINGNQTIFIDQLQAPAFIVKNNTRLVRTNQKFEELVKIYPNILNEILQNEYVEIGSYLVTTKSLEAEDKLYVLTPFQEPIQNISNMERPPKATNVDSRSVIYESLIYNSPTCVCIVDNQGIILEMNPSFLSLFNLTEELIGTHLLEHSSFSNSSLALLLVEGLRGKRFMGKEVAFPIDGKDSCTVSITLAPASFTSKGDIESVGIIMHDMTEKKRFEQELLSLKVELENTLKLQKSITYKIKKKKDNFIIDMAAGDLLNRLDLTPEDIIGKRIQEIFDHSHIHRLQPKLKSVWETGKELTYEGKYKSLEYISSVVPVIRDGEVVEVICSVSDISLLKDVQRKLLENEQKYKSIVHYNPDYIFMLNTSGIINEINPAAYEQWGNMDTSIIGGHFSRFIVDGYRKKAIEQFEKTFKSEPTKFITVVDDGKGGRMHLSLTNIPVKINDEVIGIYGIGRDITEKLKMEEALIEAKELLEAYFEHSADGIALLDPEGQVLKVNQQFGDMFGWKEEEITGKPITFIHRKDQVDQFKRNIEIVKAGKRINDVETVRYRKDQTPIDIAFNLSPILNKQGNLIGISAIIRDLSEKKRQEDLLKKSEQLAMIGQLAAGVAHEIRNPLTTLKGFLQLIVESSNNSFYLEVIQGELDRIELITNEFLALSKPRAVQFTMCSFTSLLTSSVEFIKMECLKQGVDVQFSVDDVEIYCDAHQMKQVILNVMKNALEAMPKGGLLNVSLEKKGKHAKLLIQDNGKGIPPERMKHLGEPFYSTKEKGTGLGLMICQKIMKEHHGSFTIHSVMGEGTKVEIKVPLGKTN
ncbi:PAS domain S-box protein [Bacillus seohaeanensis]|uniref:histidine kinase n=1 Tax=Bacillus seohaeanensis TaxID=284580 RepID=A0ABW5RNK4_9BACI